MTELTLEDAKVAIEKAKAARPQCSECSGFDTRSFWHFSHRCEKCAATPEFPWAARLDAEKVLAFMRSQGDGAFWLGALEKTL